MSRTFKLIDLNTPQAHSDALINAQVLLAMIRSKPESTVYGTQACRAMIIGQVGKLLATNKVVPLTLEISDKITQYFGNLKYNPLFRFDVGDNKHVKLFSKISTPYLTATQADRAWGYCVNNAQSYNTSKYFYPTLRTVYLSEESILLDMWNVLIATHLTRVALKVHNDTVGNHFESDGQLIEHCNRRILELVTEYGINTAVTVTPETVMTPYGWDCKINYYSNNGKRIGSYTVSAQRG